MNTNVNELREKLGGTKVHAVAVQKGGTGKTTITSDICFTLAKMGFKVLAIDSDPQASLSSLCNVDVLGNVPGLDDMTTILSARKTASSMSWVTSIIVVPSVLWILFTSCCI